GTSMTALRNVAVSYVTGNMPRRYREVAAPAAQPKPKQKTRVAPPRVLSVEPADEELAELEPAVSAAAKVVEAEPKGEVAPRRAPVPAPERLRAQPLAEIAPMLASCGVDLTERARQGDLDMAIGRDREIEAV